MLQYKRMISRQLSNEMWRHLRTGKLFYNVTLQDIIGTEMMSHYWLQTLEK